MSGFQETQRLHNPKIPSTRAFSSPISGVEGLITALRDWQRNATL